MLRIIGVKMIKKILIHSLNLVLLLQVGCTSSSQLQMDEYSDEYRNNITGVILKDSTEYELGRAYNIKDDTLFVYNYDSYLQGGSFQKKIPLNDISLFIYDSFSLGKTLLLCAAGLGVFVLIGALSFDMGGDLSGMGHL